MTSKIKCLLVVLLVVVLQTAKTQNKLQPSARFSFNNRSNFDDVNKQNAQLYGVSFTEDRFGNPNHAVYLFGNEFSSISLGNYPALKPKTGSISLWVKIERETYAGKGYKANPIILTKGNQNDDFYEAYGIYYILDSKKIGASGARDSLRQVGVLSKKEFPLFKWHHLVLSYDDAYFSFYIDGKLERKAVKNYETIFSETDSVLIGYTANKKNNRYLEGAVDDIEFYARVLSDDEVVSLYNAPNPNHYAVVIQRIGFSALIALGILILFLLIRFQLNRKLKREKERLEINNKLLETELRVNRALMNPHFIFNSLNTLHNFILKNNVDKASTYLLKFSKLIRKILDSNMSDSISLETELELIERYLEIEGLRFKEHIKHAVVIDPGLVPSTITIPIMMIQPFIENSVWHGLRNKKGDKIISISFSSIGSDYIQCVVEDNGTGRIKKGHHLLEKKSLATGFVEQRLELLNKIHGLACKLTIEDKPDHQGTIVSITLPILKN
jgi:hypothetical protein